MSSEDPRQLINALPELEVPVGLAAAVENRLTNTGQQPAGFSQARLTWLLLIIGLVTSLGILLYLALSGSHSFSLIDSTLVRSSIPFVELPYTELGFYALALGLMVYALGLFGLFRE